MSTLVDFHTHTNRYSACSHVTPERLILQALEARLDVLVITEHDYQWTDEQLQPLRRLAPGLTILAGVEMECDSCHLLALGLPAYDFDPFTFSPEEGIEYIHSHGGIAILAHPFRWDLSVARMLELIPLDLDAVEVDSANVDGGPPTLKALELAEIKGIPAVACSDTHSLAMFGRHATRFDVAIHTMDDLVTAIREGRCRPWWRDGSPIHPHACSLP